MEAGRSVVYKNIIYFAPFWSKQILYYLVEEDKWYALRKSMEHFNTGLAIIDECVAAVGGENNDTPTDEVWIWKDPNWELCTKMPYKQSDPAVITTADERHVIVISGNMHTKVVLPWTSYVEVYDVRQKQWNSACRLPSPFSRVEVTLCNLNVYVFPDQFPKAFKSSLNTLLSSTPGDEDIWNVIEGSPFRFSTFATNGQNVVCVGGAHITGSGDNGIYEYIDDEEEREWKQIGSLRGKGRMYSMVEVCKDKCVVVGGIPVLTNDRLSSERMNTVSIFTL